MNDIVLFVVGALSASSVMMWWFDTSLRIHILEIIRWLGYKKHDTNYWCVKQDIGIDEPFKNDLADWTPSDFDIWISEHLPSKLAELISCPGCFSLHVSYCVAALAQLITWQFNPILFVCCVFAWPWLIRASLKLIKS